LYITALSLACLSLLTFNSCKEDTILGASVVPVSDTAYTLRIEDTLTILSKTVIDDSIVTSLSLTGVPTFHGVGNVTTDPYFGNTEASMYFQVIPPSLGYVFPKKPDSAVIILPYARFTWGDTTATNIPQTFSAYELTDSLSKDSTYYSFTTKSFGPLLGSTTISFPAIKDTVTILGTKRTPHLRIKLDTAFITRMYNEANSGTSLKGYADFLRFFKGVHIKSTSAVGNAIYYFFMNGGSDFTRANIQFYYTDQTAAMVDTVKYTSFFFDQGVNAHYNRIKRTPAGYLSTLLSSSSLSDSVGAIQNEPGAALDLKFPFIKYLPKQPIIKAELVITQVNYDAADEYMKYFASARLFPVGVSPNGSTYTIMDRFPTSSTEPLFFIDGERREIEIGGKKLGQYIINIPRELQKAIVEQRDTLHLRISGAATYPGAYRLFIGGRGVSNKDLRVKLNIVYSKI
jgi:hypothetical protein